MMKISRAAEYALVAIQHLNRVSHRVSAREISEQFELPPGLIAKVLQRLASAGIVDSEHGARGGYQLRVRPEAISFLDLSAAVDGPVHPAPCGSNSGACEREYSCTVAGPVHALSDQILALLRSTSVGDLFSMGEVREGVHS